MIGLHSYRVTVPEGGTGKMLARRYWASKHPVCMVWSEGLRIHNYVTTQASNSDPEILVASLLYYRGFCSPVNLQLLPCFSEANDYSDSSLLLPLLTQSKVVELLQEC